MDVFEHFVGHYGFHYEFCNPGKGNEKGHVKSMVKYVRNNFLLPECHIKDLDQFNEKLWQKVEDDRDRPHYKKDVPIDTLYQENYSTHTPQMSLPDMPDITRGLDHYDILYEKEGREHE